MTCSLDITDLNETDLPENFRVVEDTSTCSDWSAPHYNVLDMHAALIVTAQIKRIKYRHNCDRTRVYDEATIGFDHTTVQQVLNTPGMGTNANIYSAEEIKQQCRRCLLAYDPLVETVRLKSKAVHHCLAWPEDETRSLDASAIPVVPNRAIGVAAFSTVITPFRQRMYHAALEWQNVTDKPPAEEKSGLVIWLDPTSIGLEYATVLAEIVRPVSSISVLSGPTCATAFLPTGQVCHEYGKGLVEYLKAEFPGLTAKGYTGGAGVTFKIVASTAAAISRMVLSEKLLCPPRTPTCLFPSLSKIPQMQYAKILEDPNWMKAVDFFTIAGTHGVVSVKVLEESQIPNTYTSDPNRRVQDTVPDQFSHVNAMVDDEGYPEGITRPVIAADQAISELTDQQILDDIAIALNRVDNNPSVDGDPNVFRKRLEIIPTMDMIQDAIANNKPLTVNDVTIMLFPNGTNGNGDGDSPQYRHGELSTDADSGRTAPPPGIEYWEEVNVQRHDSLLRIQADWETAFYGHISDTPKGGDDPSTIYEIYCPETTAHGGTITYFDGVATTTDPDTVIIASKDGVTIRDRETGAVIANGLENTPIGTAFHKEGDYQLKDVADDFTTQRRRVVQLDFAKLPSLPFTQELAHICKEYSKRKVQK